MAAGAVDAARVRDRVSRKSVWGRVHAGPSALLGMLLAIFLGLPLLGLVVRALGAGGLLDAMQRPIVLEALRLSLLTTSLVLLVALLLGSPLALLLARSRFRGIGLLDSLIDLPIVLPPAVAGLALLVTFGRRGLLGGPLGAVGIELPFTTAAVVLASLFVAAPFYVRAARSGFLAVPREFEEAARVEGATEWQVFRYVTAPVAAPALFGGAILCWARALGEFGATIMFAGQFPGRTQTMPLAIYAALESDTDAALGLSVMLLAISFALLMLFRRWLRTYDTVGFS
jgi:molybdate transport system permease protein